MHAPVRRLPTITRSKGPLFEEKSTGPQGEFRNGVTAGRDAALDARQILFGGSQLDVKVQFPARTHGLLEHGTGNLAQCKGPAQGATGQAKGDVDLDDRRHDGVAGEVALEEELAARKAEGGPNRLEETSTA